MKRPQREKNIFIKVIKEDFIRQGCANRVDWYSMMFATFEEAVADAQARCLQRVGRVRTKRHSRLEHAMQMRPSTSWLDHLAAKTRLH
ncbi:hypothetical protein ABIE91_001459 [Bradyrhizobium elkanii]|jgi:hypothetical protein